jgi:hypothetical protein
MFLPFYCECGDRGRKRRLRRGQEMNEVLFLWTPEGTGKSLGAEWAAARSYGPFLKPGTYLSLANYL